MFSSSRKRPRRSKPTQRMTGFYILALSLVALLSITGQILKQSVFAQQYTDSRVINIAGQQRMLSQRISKAAMAIQDAPDLPSLQHHINELQLSMSIWERSQIGLQEGDSELGLPGTNSPRVEQMFHDADAPYRAMQQAVYGLLQTLEQAPTPNQVQPSELTPFIDQILFAERAYQQHMNSIAFQYDREARERVKKTMHIEWSLLGITLCVLVVEGLFIFRPAVNSIRRTLVEVKAAEARLAATAEQLSQANAELTIALEEAHEVTRAKSEFLAVTSHEIRTPINAIIGMTSLLQDTHLSPSQRDFVQTIQISSETLLGIINDILDFSKIEANQMEIECHPFDLYRCIEDAMELVAQRASEKHLDLIYVIEPGTPTNLIGDATRLRQILVNLLNNAVKFTNRGEVILMVTSVSFAAIASNMSTAALSSIPEECRKHPDAFALHISIKDTGIGIPANRMHRLFQSFSQVDASISRKYGGTGLGLVICKRLAEMMGGTMWAESKFGHGSTFHVRILTKKNSEGDTPEWHLQEQPLLSGKHILIVDGNATRRIILYQRVQWWQMQPVAAASAQEALNIIAQQGPFDLALVNFQLPDMAGQEMIAQARQYAPNLPVILMAPMTSRLEIRDAAAICHSNPIRLSRLYYLLTGIFMPQPFSQSEVVNTFFDQQIGEKYPLHILLAEDNAVNQKISLLLLEKIGYRADLAASGLEVLEALERQNYDVIFMDVQMPDMDGIETTRHIRMRRLLQPIPWIIALTATTLRGDRDYLLAAGMHDYVGKPVQIRDLVEAIERYMQQKSHSLQEPIQDQRSVHSDREMLEIWNHFLGDTEKIIADMFIAEERQNLPLLTHLAQTIRLSSTTMGEEQIVARAAALESSIRYGNTVSIQEQIKDIQTAYEQACQGTEKP